MDRYDAVTYVHWLYWRLKCLESGHMDFQRLFENVALRAAERGDAFMRVKPHGRLGDKKADGLYWGSGTVFQVYSPDRVERATTLRKIKEDLAGAVEEWGDELKAWVFVYNTRAGVAADVPALLKQQAKKYPGLTIRPMSDDDLWKEVVRPLPVQDRVEVLGPPPGFEALFPLAATLPEEVQERLRHGRFVVVQDTLSPIDLNDALTAMRPALPLGPPLYLRRPGDVAWEVAADQQRRLVEEAIERSREHLPRFAVFSLTPIPLGIHLGYLLSDRVEVVPFQYDRDRKTWAWKSNLPAPDLGLTVRGLPEQRMPGPVEVAIRISLSARIDPAETIASAGSFPVEVDIEAQRPDVMWLAHPEQIAAFAKAFRDVLARLRELVPEATRLHLFYAGPMGCAVAAGQAINPRMNPPVQLYEYDRRKQPRYEPALALG